MDTSSTSDKAIVNTDSLSNIHYTQDNQHTQDNQQNSPSEQAPPSNRCGCTVVPEEMPAL